MADVDPRSQGGMRTCVGCPAQLDLAAHMAGERDQPGWRRVCCGYICPACWDAGHYPTYRPIAGTTTAHPSCGCGWEGETPCARLADIEEAWAVHNREREGVAK